MMKPKSPPKTHFICLPLRTADFRNKVTAWNAFLPPTIHPSIIRPTGSLHFTLGVMSLVTPEEIDSAHKTLQTCRSDALSAVQGRKLTVNLKGIASMQANFRKASVIYAVPDPGDGRLQTLSSTIPIQCLEVDEICYSQGSRKPNSWRMIDIRLMESRYAKGGSSQAKFSYIVHY